VSLSRTGKHRLALLAKVPHAANLEGIRRRYRLLREQLDERGRRLWAATEADLLGWGGIALVAAATGISRPCIHRGLNELGKAVDTSQIASIDRQPSDHSIGAGSSRRVRLPGGGRKLTEEKDPTIMADLARMLADEVAGDPMGKQKWVRSSLRHLSKELAAQGHQASTTTVSRMLKKMDFSQKSNKRKDFTRRCPERDEQFQYIGSQRKAFTAAGLPIISVDTKKKELIGEFRNPGRVWCKQASEVHEHDFPSFAECHAVPFGVYDVTRNEGCVYVGTSNNTPAFAVGCIARWWEHEGRMMYPAADQLLILADSGGSNGCRARAWKHNLQVGLCERFGLNVTVCHYPTACSKWNPVEHRLFSFISINWAGKPLRTLDTMLGYINGTTTATGLKVKAFLQDSLYQRGERVTREDIDHLNLRPHAVIPKWNYTLCPRHAK